MALNPLAQDPPWQGRGQEEQNDNFQTCMSLGIKTLITIIISGSVCVCVTCAHVHMCAHENAIVHLWHCDPNLGVGCHIPPCVRRSLSFTAVYVSVAGPCLSRDVPLPPPILL